jgi:hypothetical protein
MKVRILIFLSTAVFLFLLSGCSGVRPYVATANMMGFTHPCSKVFKGTGRAQNHFSYVPSSGVLNSRDSAIMNLKKINWQLSISFPPSARFEF